jgi:hypothetical protein
MRAHRGCDYRRKWTLPHSLLTAPSLGFNVTMGGPPEYPTTVYKTGFAYYGGLDFPAYFNSLDYKQHVLFVKPFNGTREERLKQLRQTIFSTGCDQAGVSMKNLFGLWNSLYQGAKNLAVEPQDEESLQWMRTMVAMAWASQFDPKTVAEMYRLQQDYLKEHVK